MTRSQIVAIVFVVAVIWGVTLLLMGVPLTRAHAGPFSVTVSGTALVMLVFNRWAWRWRIFRGWLVKKPWFEGTWKLRLESTYRNPETGEPAKPVAYYVVRQTYFQTSLRMFTAEQSSELLGVDIRAAEDDMFVLHGTFLSTPKQAVRERSEIHYGGLLLHLNGNPVKRLSGHYWTDRLTRGDVESTGRSRVLFGSFDEANARLGD